MTTEEQHAETTAILRNAKSEETPERKAARARYTERLAISQGIPDLWIVYYHDDWTSYDCCGGLYIDTIHTTQQAAEKRQTYLNTVHGLDFEPYEVMKLEPDDREPSKIKCQDKP